MNVQETYVTDVALENANGEKKQILSEILEADTRLSLLKERLRSVERFIEQWHTFAAGHEITFDEKTAPIVNKTGSTQTHRGRTVGNTRKEIVVETARGVISERNEPIGRSELFKELTARGVVLNGKDPEMVLSTMLWRMKDKIIRLSKGGYWLTERPSPDGSYVPGDEPSNELPKPNFDDLL
jgi:hypothetical protein